MSTKSLSRFAGVSVLMAFSWAIAAQTPARADGKTEVQVGTDVSASSDSGAIRQGETVGVSATGFASGTRITGSLSAGYAENKGIGSYDVQFGGASPGDKPGVHPYIHSGTSWTHGFASDTAYTVGLALAAHNAVLSLEPRIPNIIPGLPAKVGPGGIIYDRSTGAELGAAGLRVTGVARLSSKTQARLSLEADALTASDALQKDLAQPESGTFEEASAGLSYRLGQHWSLNAEGIAQRAQYTATKTDASTGAVSIRNHDDSDITVVAGAAVDL